MKKLKKSDQEPQLRIQLARLIFSNGSQIQINAILNRLMDIETERNQKTIK
jgi:hypothetical protein